MFKVLVVDDEPVLRKGIVSLIDWHSLECKIAGECQDGAEALEFLENNKADIVVTDIKMPRMDGLSLAKKIHEDYAGTRVIILTAFSEFSLAHEAIRASVGDYVIKTNFVDELPKAVETIIKELKYSGQSISHANLSVADIEHYKDLIIKDVLLGTIMNEDEIAIKFKSLQIDFNNYFVVVSELNDSDYDISAYKKEALKRFFCLAFNNHRHRMVWLNRQTLAAIINFDSLDENINLQSIVVIFNDMLSIVNDNMNLRLNFGVSARHSKPNEIATAYKEAVISLSLAFRDSSFIIYNKESAADADFTHHDLEKDTASVMLEFIFEKQYGKCEAYLQNVFEKYRQSVFDIERVKIDWLIITSTCFRQISEWDITSFLLDDYAQSVSKRILCCKSINLLYGTLCDAFLHMCELDLNRMENKNQLVSSVNKYIMSNYENRIKLDDIADSLHINASYLSRIYKKHTGDSIFTALNKYRVAKAKFLLERGEYKVSEVALLVGFDDPSYFTSVFMKYAGESPKNYKGK